MTEFISLKSITQAHEMMGIEKPKHPLVSVFRHTPETIKYFGDIKISTDFYFVALKDGINGKFGYGRSHYDFEEGFMTFVAPGQVITLQQSEVNYEDHGWSLIFHPDLIRRSELGRNIEKYSFFDYEVNEALHLSIKEKQILTELVLKIEEEIGQNIDKHTQKLIVSNIELLLDYCTRYYDRQFYTRTNLNKDISIRFEDFIKEYFKSEKQLEHGIPSVKFCSEQLNMSSNYMSDLLKKETGKNAQDHIHSFIIEKAKNILLNSKETVSQVAYRLGFEYSQHFSKVFKTKTGMTPKEYRISN